ncbi:hypothetical protein WN51_07997 [Melipona quadrifasciata]|uniref:Uncharacterized protein n=1 Tax=Melipona quadrifasciata TaxID=166423 RepID=A0A0N0BBS3_9HYME|nr:hypothetical protein WN51_07997 [Melipona quadrifasciata]
MQHQVYMFIVIVSISYKKKKSELLARVKITAAMGDGGVIVSRIKRRLTTRKTPRKSIQLAIEFESSIGIHCIVSVSLNIKDTRNSNTSTVLSNSLLSEKNLTILPLTNGSRVRNVKSGKSAVSELRQRINFVRNGNDTFGLNHVSDRVNCARLCIFVRTRVSDIPHQISWFKTSLYKPEQKRNPNRGEMIEDISYPNHPNWRVFMRPTLYMCICTRIENFMLVAQQGKDKDVGRHAVVLVNYRLNCSHLSVEYFDTVVLTLTTLLTRPPDIQRITSVSKKRRSKDCSSKDTSLAFTRGKVLVSSGSNRSEIQIDINYSSQFVTILIYRGKYHSGLTCDEVIIGFAIFKLSGSLDEFVQLSVVQYITRIDLRLTEDE